MSPRPDSILGQGGGRASFPTLHLHLVISAPGAGDGGAVLCGAVQWRPHRRHFLASEIGAVRQDWVRTGRLEEPRCTIVLHTHSYWPSWETVWTGVPKGGVSRQNRCKICAGTWRQWKGATLFVSEGV